MEPSSKQTEIYEKIVKFNRIIRPVFAVFNKSKEIRNDNNYGILIRLNYAVNRHGIHSNYYRNIFWLFG